jgi:hypothetical protein
LPTTEKDVVCMYINVFSGINGGKNGGCNLHVVEIEFEAA